MWTGSLLHNLHLWKTVSECKAYDSSPLFLLGSSGGRHRNAASGLFNRHMLNTVQAAPLCSIPYLLSWQLRWPETGPKVARELPTWGRVTSSLNTKEECMKFAEGIVWHLVNELIHLPSDIFKKACIALLCSSATCDATTGSSLQHKGWKWLRPLSLKLNKFIIQ